MERLELKRCSIDTLNMDAERDLEVKLSKEIAQKLDKLCQDMDEERSALVRRLIHKELAKYSYLNDDEKEKKAVNKEDENKTDIQEYVRENREMVERVAEHGDRLHAAMALAILKTAKEKRAESESD